jgi:hypothetical protein
VLFGSWEKDIALLIKNGWQKLKAIKQARGGIIARIGHLSLFNVTEKRELGPLLVTGS